MAARREPSYDDHDFQQYQQHMDSGAYGEPHPYDAPFAYMSAMRKDIQDLRQALHAEQQQRAEEVLELKQEVITLREALKKEIAERNAISHRFQLDITKLSSGSGKGVDELKAVHRQQLGQLNQMLQDEIRDRRASEALRNTREDSAVSEHKVEFATMGKEMNAHKAAFYAFKDETANRINNVVHDIEAIVGQIFKVGYSAESFKAVSFMSSHRSEIESHMRGPSPTRQNHGY